MKTKFFAFAALAAMLASCTVEVTEQSLTDKPITVTADVDKLMTRAGYEGTSVLPETFYLSLDQSNDKYDYTDMLMTKSADGNVYTPASQLLWAGSADATVTAATFSLSGEQELSVATDQSTSDALQSSDHLFMAGRSVTPSSDGIAVEFGHLMSKVFITITLGDEFEEEENPITAIAVKGTVPTRGYTVGSGWSSLSAEAADIIPLENVYTAPTSFEPRATVEYEVILVPQEIAARGFVVSFSIGSRKFKWTAPAGITLESGCQYTLDISAGKNKATMGATSVRDWNCIAIEGGDAEEVEEEDEPVTPPATAVTYTVNGVSFTMIAVDGGTFTMGSPDSDSDAYDDEKPAHQVTLSSFAIGETEVTQELWQAVMGSNPSCFTGDLQHPVECVSWNDCQTFITTLDELTGATFRLPTEAEWEYAARGGNASEGYKYSGSNTIGDVAWYTSNSSSSTHPVKTKQPNELGIYDMSGNVWEWCADWFCDSYYASSPENNPTGPSSGSDRVVRGGVWYSDAGDCRVANRDNCRPDSRLYSSGGLRLAMSCGGENTPSTAPAGVEAVDLGLSVKWASCNVGAESPEEYGDHFAWGETTTKSSYTESTSVTYGLSIEELESRGIIDANGNLTAAYDAATANWGGSWRMPTLDEIGELLNQCTWEWTTQNGVYGQLVTGPNGNSIFLPAAGYRYGTSLGNEGSCGYCWSATRNGSSGSFNLGFTSGKFIRDCSMHDYGFTVRPVSEE